VENLSHHQASTASVAYTLLGGFIVAVGLLTLSSMSKSI
jgi:hypothetical protein